MTTQVDGSIRIVDDAPLIMHLSDEILGEHLPRIAKAYRSSIRDDLRMLLRRYNFVDFAQKVVGVGSVGTRCYIVLMQGSGPNDPLFLQIKQASASVLEPYAGKSRYTNHGQRVVRGQQYIQAASDIFLGWGREKWLDIYVRQLRDMKGSADVASMDPKRMALYGPLCGWLLRARTPGPVTRPRSPDTSGPAIDSTPRWWSSPMRTPTRPSATTRRLPRQSRSVGYGPRQIAEPRALLVLSRAVVRPGENRTLIRRRGDGA